MKLSRVVLSCLLLLATGLAEGTRLWQQSKYDEFEKGTAHGVAINSDGGLSLAPTFDLSLHHALHLFVGPGIDSSGNVYAAAGSPARVYRITPDGKATIIFAPQELRCRRLAIDGDGAIYAATSPDGKVYKIVRGAVLGKGRRRRAIWSRWFDPAYTASVYFDPKTKYIWALALDKQGRLYVGTGDQGEIFRVEPNGNGAVFFKSDEAQVRVLAFDHAGNLIAGTDGSGLVYRITPAG